MPGAPPPSPEEDSDSCQGATEEGRPCSPMTRLSEGRPSVDSTAAAPLDTAVDKNGSGGGSGRTSSSGCRTGQKILKLILDNLPIVLSLGASLFDFAPVPCLVTICWLNLRVVETSSGFPEQGTRQASPSREQTISNKSIIK